jgi:hypothetical protein
MAPVIEKGGLKILSVFRAISRFYVSSANKAKRKPDPRSSPYMSSWHPGTNLNSAQDSATKFPHTRCLKSIAVSMRSLLPVSSRLFRTSKHAEEQIIFHEPRKFTSSSSSSTRIIISRGCDWHLHCAIEATYFHDRPMIRIETSEASGCRDLHPEWSTPRIVRRF